MPLKIQSFVIKSKTKTNSNLKLNYIQCVPKHAKCTTLYQYLLIVISDGCLALIYLVTIPDIKECNRNVLT